MPCMDRSVWTDERLDDLAGRGESQFELLRSETRELRAEMREFRGEMRDMRAEMHADSTRIRRDMFHWAIALFAALSRCTRRWSCTR